MKRRVVGITGTGRRLERGHACKELGGISNMKKMEFKKKVVIQKNIKIDRNLIKKAEAFEKKLSEYGESTKSKYTLTPPLNTSNTFLFNR